MGLTKVEDMKPPKTYIRLNGKEHAFETKTGGPYYGSVSGVIIGINKHYQDGTDKIAPHYTYRVDLQDPSSSEIYCVILRESIAVTKKAINLLSSVEEGDFGVIKITVLPPKNPNHTTSRLYISNNDQNLVFRFNEALKDENGRFQGYKGLDDSNLDDLVADIYRKSTGKEWSGLNHSTDTEKDLTKPLAPKKDLSDLIKAIEAKIFKMDLATLKSSWPKIVDTMESKEVGDKLSYMTKVAAQRAEDLGVNITFTVSGGFSDNNTDTGNVEDDDNLPF